MFDRAALVAACHAACRQPEPLRAVREVILEALAAPGDVAALGTTDGGITLLHRGADLTILHAVRPPHLRLYPHEHGGLWAVIGLYEGREDHVLYRRSSVRHSTLTESGGRRLVAGDALVLGDDAIHAVTNPGGHTASGIHVYGGDLLDQPRRQWWPGPFQERPYDFEAARRQFAGAGATPRCDRRGSATRRDAADPRAP